MRPCYELRVFWFAKRKKQNASLHHAFYFKFSLLHPFTIPCSSTASWPCPPCQGSWEGGSHRQGCLPAWSRWSWRSRRSPGRPRNSRWRCRWSSWSLGRLNFKPIKQRVSTIDFYWFLTLKIPRANLNDLKVNLFNYFKRKQRGIKLNNKPS